MYSISVQSTLISIGFISKGAVFVGPICILPIEQTSGSSELSPQSLFPSHSKENLTQFPFLHSNGLHEEGGSGSVKSRFEIITEKCVSEINLSSSNDIGNKKEEKKMISKSHVVLLRANSAMRIGCDSFGQWKTSKVFVFCLL